jgi:phospholipid/cholesterol/gamma-HCH transport system permease protein
MKIDITDSDRGAVLEPQGRLDVETASAFLEAVEGQLRRRNVRSLSVNVGGLDYIDSAGAAVLIEGYHRCRKQGRSYTLRNLTEDVRRIFALTEGGAMLEPSAPLERPRPGFVEWVGERVWGAWRGMQGFLGMTLDSCAMVLAAPFRRRAIRWDLALRYMERTGWDAIPIVATIAALIGGVLALQAAAQLEHYGALIFVPHLVAVSLTRELGPLITAIIVAGRSGSAFAAEIGTMKVNEEVDALRTMGLSPVGFLVVPKFVALIVMMPCLVTLANTVGILGGAVVATTSLDLAPGIYFEETIKALHVRDIVTGLIKSVVFAALIAATGCFRGFEVEGDADSVGRKTTSAVVTSIFLVILADALFTALFFYIE